MLVVVSKSYLWRFSGYQLLMTGFMCLLDLFRREVGGLLTLHEPLLGDFCWDVQIRKNEVTMEIKKYL